MYPVKPVSNDDLRRFFSGLTEYAFQTHLGVADPPLVEYLGQLLARFFRSDTIFAIRNLSGRRLDAVADMLVEADARIGEAKRQVHRHIGDFTLFWTGVYPEALAHFQRGPRKDFFLDYCEHGKRAYYIASTIPARDADAENALLERSEPRFRALRLWPRRSPPRMGTPRSRRRTAARADRDSVSGRAHPVAVAEFAKIQPSRGTRDYHKSRALTLHPHPS